LESINWHVMRDVLQGISQWAAKRETTLSPALQTSILRGLYDRFGDPTTANVLTTSSPVGAASAKTGDQVESLPDSVEALLHEVLGTGRTSTAPSSTSC
jgi:hypothetical protein